jgi:hypothetical protein
LVPGGYNQYISGYEIGRAALSFQPSLTVYRVFQILGQRGHEPEKYDDADFRGVRLSEGME